jgi:predicted  nucleic acid-binding Zn-ribbon protein
MNPVEQRTYTTRMNTIEKKMEKLENEVADALLAIQNHVTKEVEGERTHRLKLADDQRNYVDLQDRALHQLLQQTRTDLRFELAQLRDRTFWARLRWLFTGR